MWRRTLHRRVDCAQHLSLVCSIAQIEVNVHAQARAELWSLGLVQQLHLSGAHRALPSHSEPGAKHLRSMLRICRAELHIVTASDI